MTSFPRGPDRHDAATSPQMTLDVERTILDGEPPELPGRTEVRRRNSMDIVLRLLAPERMIEYGNAVSQKLADYIAYAESNPLSHGTSEAITDLNNAINRLVRDVISIWPSPVALDKPYFVDDISATLKLTVPQIVSDVLNAWQQFTVAVGINESIGEVDPRAGPPHHLHLTRIILEIFESVWKLSSSIWRRLREKNAGQDSKLESELKLAEGSLFVAEGLVDIAVWGHGILNLHDTAIRRPPEESQAQSEVILRGWRRRRARDSLLLRDLRAHRRFRSSWWKIGVERWSGCYASDRNEEVGQMLCPGQERERESTFDPHQRQFLSIRRSRSDLLRSSADRFWPTRHMCTPDVEY